MSSIQTFHFRLLYTKTDTRPNLIFKMNISAFFSILHCFFILALSGHTMWKLMWFLSSAQVLISNVSNQSESLLFPLWFDTGLVVLFVFQHSYLKTSQIGNYLARYRITKSVARSIYVVLTSVALQIIMFFWMPIPSYCLWKLDSDSSIVWWTISVSHLIAWACIYGGSVILDLPELVGIKQIYYFCLNLPETSDLKSTELQRLYSHKRHPSFMAFLALLWVTPVMSFDRALLASALTLYMIAAWEPTLDDTRYHQRQLQQKQHEISYSNRRKQLNSEKRNYRG